MDEAEAVEKQKGNRHQREMTHAVEEEWTIENLICLCIKFWCLVLSLFGYMFIFILNCHPIRFERLGAIGVYILWPITPSSESRTLKSWIS